MNRLWRGSGSSGLCTVSRGRGFCRKRPAGHLIADVFCVSPELDNLVPQAKNVNLKQYRDIERKWQKALSANPPQKVTDIKIEIMYDGKNVRPAAFNIEYCIDGTAYFPDTIYNN